MSTFNITPRNKMVYLQIMADLIIAGIGCLTISMIVAGYLIAHDHQGNEVLGIFLVFSGIFALIVLIYGSLIEPSKLVIRHQRINLKDYKGKPVSIVLLADLHVGRYNNTQRMKKAVEAALAVEEADYALILGDSINDSPDHVEELDSLRELAEKKKTYAVLGNHDYTRKEKDHPPELIDKLIHKYESLGITLLRNQTAELDLTDGIVIGGIGDLWPDDAKFTEFDAISPDIPFILISHNPDGVKYAHEKMAHPEVIDLVISGHTHGGEIRAPVIGPVFPIPTELPNSYDQGLHDYNGTPVFITSGLGNIATRIRLLNPPEIVILTIE